MSEPQTEAPAPPAEKQKHHPPRPAAQAQPARELPPAPPAMPYLGTLAAPELRQAKKQRGVAALPCVVLGADGVPIGILVVANPGYLGEALLPHLEAAGLAGPFKQVHPNTLDDAGKKSAARAIMRSADAQLDKIGALASFGYRPSMLA